MSTNCTFNCTHSEHEATFFLNQFLTVQLIVHSPLPKELFSSKGSCFNVFVHFVQFVQFVLYWFLSLSLPAGLYCFNVLFDLFFQTGFWYCGSDLTAGVADLRTCGPNKY